MITTADSSVISTVITDQLGHISSTSVVTVPRPAPSSRYQPSPSPPLSSTAAGLLHQLFQPPRRHLRRGIFTRPLLRTARASMAAPTCTLRDTHISPPLTRPTPSSSTECVGLLQFRFLPSQRSYRAVREHLEPSPSRSRSASTQSFKTTHRLLPDHRPSIALLPHLPRTPRRHRLALGALQHARLRPSPAFHRIFLQVPTPSGSKINLRHAYCASSWSINYGSACLQCHETRTFAGWVSSRSVAPTFMSCCPSP